MLAAWAFWVFYQEFRRDRTQLRVDVDEVSVKSGSTVERIRLAEVAQVYLMYVGKHLTPGLELRSGTVVTVPVIRSDLALRLYATLLDRTGASAELRTTMCSAISDAKRTIRERLPELEQAAAQTRD